MYICEKLVVPDTESQYKQVIDRCKDLFMKKTMDYGTAWRILRPSSLTDQIFIKASRIRSIQEKGNQKVDDSIHSEFVGIVNYGVMALIQLDLADNDEMEIAMEKVEKLYDDYTASTRNLMNQKNHDYGEAWRDMRISSMTDLILMKILRIKQIEENEGETLVSEGLDANYMDIVNYAVFSQILLNEQSTKDQ